LIFKTARKKEIIQNQFSIEDYVLDEIGSYAFSSDKEIYFKNDSLRFFAAAKDANGLNLLDGKATLLLTTGTINKYYQDTLFVRDTIYNKEIQMAANGDTKFAIAATDLPRADITINATLIFKNSNNELHEEKKSITYKYQSKEILVSQIGDSIKAVYVEDGVERSVEGESGMNDEPEWAIHFPLTQKIDPIAQDYSFYVNDKKGKMIVSEDFEVEKNYTLNFSRSSNGDTLGFTLNNPYKIPVYFTVFNGNGIIASGKQDGALVSWKKLVSNRRQTYKLRWQYIWAGKEQQGEETLGLLYKLLNVKISSNPTVYPGQKDSIHINVKDFKGIAAANVNLTAFTYNNQFNRDIKVPDLPYIATYKSRRFLQRNGFENDEDEFSLTGNYLLGKNKAWVNKFHLDSMAYYRLLLPKNKYEDVVTQIGNIVPQLSVSVVRQGVPQEIFLLYLNRQLVYYNGATDKMKYAFEVFPGYVQIGIRLKDKYIELDSVYTQPNYKHDMSFDLDNLPEHASVTKVDEFWSYTEMDLLEQSMWQMQNDYANNFAYLWQGTKLVHLSENKLHIAGP
ncbi:MAG: hypothetical protein ABIU30_07610, partial [Ferruginibacter sp.]